MGIIISDGYETIYANLTVAVIQVNDDPFNVSIALPDTEMIEGSEQIVSGTCSDPDIEFGDTMTFSWTSDISGFLGYGEEIDLHLPAGTHSITLLVTDSAGSSVSKTVIIEVHKEDDQPENEGLSATDLAIISIALVLLIIIIAIAIFYFRTQEEVFDFEDFEE